MSSKYLFLLLVVMLCACGGSSQNPAPLGGDSLVVEMDTLLLPADSVAQAVPVQDLEKEVSTVKSETVQEEKKGGKFIVISKLHETLTVFDAQHGDTLQLAQYPCCMGKNKGNKEKKGDMRTPESPKGKPFFISQIADAHTWHHDFGDGRGSILAYGHWFLRLNTPGHSGIGIHGSTNNESTVPGRASEGCIRLRDADIIDLKEKYAYVGMPVIVKAEGEE